MTARRIESEVSFDLNYEGFGVHTSSSVELFLNRGSDQVYLDTDR